MLHSLPSANLTLNVPNKKDCTIFILVLFLFQDRKLLVQVSWTRKTVVQTLPFRSWRWSTRSPSLIRTTGCPSRIANWRLLQSLSQSQVKEISITRLQNILHNSFLCRFFSCSVSGDEEGPLCDTISRKTLFYLIATLNASFHPDYDFSHARSEEFSREPSIQVCFQNNYQHI